MSTEKLKPHQLFDDLAEKQRVIKANRPVITLEEARAKAQWIKEERSDKKKRPE
ncbi:MAG: hypothetical protein WAU01_17140 [Saprospiraceae bacterium]